MKKISMAVLISATLLISACSGGSSTDSKSASSKPAKPAAVQKKAKATPRGSKVTGKIRPGSKFSKIKLGMTMSQVNSLIGTPNDLKRHETGKRWIPFYYGSDVQRMQALHGGEGCLTYNGGNVFGGGGNKLIGINVDPSGKCY